MNLRSDPSTLAAQQPQPFAGGRKSGRSWSSQAWWSGAPAQDLPGRRRQRVLERSHRGGEHGSIRNRIAKRCMFRARALHSAVLGPCCSGQQCPELLPFTEAGAIARTVLAAKAATPPRGGRGKGRQTAWLLSVISRPSRAASAARRTNGMARPPNIAKAAFRGLAGKPTRVRWATTGGNADRGDGPARRRIPGSRACPRVEHALQRSVEQSQPREAEGHPFRSRGAVASGRRGL